MPRRVSGERVQVGIGPQSLQDFDVLKSAEAPAFSLERPKNDGCSAQLIAFRAGGCADSNACRTVRRCTPCRPANSRTDNPSTRASLRISANTSTLDLILASSPEKTSRRDHDQVGPNQTVTTTPASHKVEPEQTVTPGPLQTVITTMEYAGLSPLSPAADAPPSTVSGTELRESAREELAVAVTKARREAAQEFAQSLTTQEQQALPVELLSEDTTDAHHHQRTPPDWDAGRRQLWEKMTTFRARVT